DFHVTGVQTCALPILVGLTAARQIQDVIKNLSLSGKSNLAMIVSIVTLIIGATTVFGDMQNSINKIWHVKAKPKKGWLKLIMDRSEERRVGKEWRGWE